MTAFTESVVEQAALAWLESLGWLVPHDLDPSSTVCFINLRYISQLRPSGERSDTPESGFVATPAGIQFWRSVGGSATPQAWNTLPTVPLGCVRSV